MSKDSGHQFVFHREADTKISFIYRSMYIQICVYWSQVNTKI
jgi:hypothetical protein